MEKNNLIFTGIALVVLLGLLNFYAIKTMNVEATVDMSNVDIPETDLSGLVTTDQLNTAISGIVIPASTTTVVNGTVVSTPSVDYSGEYVLTKDDFEEEATEAEALRLATEYIESKDFNKKKLMTALNDKINDSESEIESYRDITEVKILDIDVVQVGETSFIKVDAKVYFFIEDDEDEAYKSRVKFTVKVKDLDFDDDFEDAEVREGFTEITNVRYIREL